MKEVWKSSITIKGETSRTCSRRSALLNKVLFLGSFVALISGWVSNPIYAQNINKNMVTFISEMNEKFAEMKIVKESVKDKEEQKLRLHKDATAKEADIKSAQDELNKITQSYNAKLIEVKTKDVEQTAKENDVNKTMTSIQDLESRIKKKSAEATTKAEEIVAKNNSINQRVNDILDKTEIAEKKTKEVNSKQAEVNLKTNAISNLTKEITEKTNEIVKRSSETDTVLKVLQSQLTKLNIDKDTAQNELNRTRQEYDKLKLEETKLRAELQGFKDDLSRQREEKEAMNNFVKQANGEIEVLEKEVTGLKAKLNNQKSEFERIRADKMSFKDQADNIKIQLLASEGKLKSATEARQKLLNQAELLRKEIEVAKSEVFELTFQGVDNAKKSEVRKAIELYTMALGKDPQNAQALFLRGYAFFVSGEVKPALLDINKSIDIKADSPETYMVRADLEVADADYLAATKDYETIISMDARNKEAYFHKATINYYFLNETKKACDDWMKAEELGHDDVKLILDTNCNPAKPRKSFAMLQITTEARDTTYGFNPKNPIKVGRGENIEEMHRNETAYLELLRGQSGELVKYQRLGTCCQYNSDNGVNGIANLDKFQVTYTTKRGTNISRVIYISSYDYDKPLLPKGFKTTHKVD